VAQVTGKQREKTEERTGDRSYPMETAAQIRSAIKLRHNGKTKSAAEVLRLASSAVSRLLKSGKISAGTADSLRRAIADARERDNMSTYLLDEYVSTSPGDPYRLFPFGRIVKDGRVREITKELAAMFKLPHFKPPIKLGTHDEATPAGGHIIGLEVREDGLYAVPEYNEKGEEALSSGSYRYQSPEVIWEGGGLEDPETGEMITGPLIVGDALLHMPHLGEAAALYTITPLVQERDMDEEKNLIERFTAAIEKMVNRIPEPAPEPEPEPEQGIEPEEFEAAVKERDEYRAKWEALEAEGKRKEKVEHFVAELPEGDIFSTEDAELLADLDEETAEKVLARFKALGAQLAENDELTEEKGSSAGGEEDPRKALDGQIKAYAEEHKLDYNAAMKQLAVEKPELFGG